MMQKSMTYFLFSFVFVMGESLWAVELVSLKDFLNTELSSFDKLSRETFTLSEDQKKDLKKTAPDALEENFNFFYGRNKEGVLERACTVVPQKGKEGPLSIGVCFKPGGLVHSVTILSHEEDRGWKITEQTFLKQFQGKKMTESFLVGSDLDGISGATRSSKAVAEALRKATFAYRTFVYPNVSDRNVSDPSSADPNVNRKVDPEAGEQK